MKRLFPFFIFCLLFLAAGCGAVPAPKTVSVELPTPALPTDAPPETANSLIRTDTGDARIIRLGDRFSELAQGGDVLFQGLHCLVRRNVLSISVVSTPSESVQAEHTTRIPVVYAAVSTDGQTVTGLITWTQQPDGSWFCTSEGIAPIEPVADPAALEGLSAEALEERLGPCSFDAGSGRFIPCWFTVDGKLICPGAQVLDLLFEDPDLICIRQLDGSTEIENEARWNAFLETTARGEPDEVTLRIYHYLSNRTVLYSDDLSQEDAIDLSLPLYSDQLLRYDGELYSIMDKPALSADSATAEDWSSYPYLIVSVEEAPRPQMKWRSATYYLLSADPNMTHERWFSSMVSSVYDPDFPTTCPLFTVYHGDEWKKYEKP